MIVYLIVNRRLNPPTIEDLKAEIRRTESKTTTALNLAEYIEKKGDKQWVDPLIDEVGPWAMIQLADLANLVEVLQKYVLTSQRFPSLRC